MRAVMLWESVVAYWAFTALSSEVTILVASSAWASLLSIAVSFVTSCSMVV